jgi:hypothetical protein
MELLFVLRSYVGSEQRFGPVTIRPWGTAEASHEVLEGLQGPEAIRFAQAVQARDVSMCMVADGQPVHPINEAAVLKKYKSV